MQTIYNSVRGINSPTIQTVILSLPIVSTALTISHFDLAKELKDINNLDPQKVKYYEKIEDFTNTAKIGCVVQMITSLALAILFVQPEFLAITYFSTLTFLALRSNEERQGHEQFYVQQAVVMDNSKKGLQRMVSNLDRDGEYETALRVKKIILSSQEGSPLGLLPSEIRQEIFEQTGQASNAEIGEGIKKIKDDMK